MSVLAWSPEKRLLVMFHKILRWERRAGQSTAIVNLSPASVVTLPLQPGETMIGEVTNRTGRRLRFGNQAVYLESDRQWVRVPYDSIVAHHCMAERTDVPQDESLKKDYYRSLNKHYGARIILVDRQGSRYELDGLGQAFQGLHHFSPGCWIEATSRGSQQVVDEWLWSEYWVYCAISRFSGVRRLSLRPSHTWVQLQSASESRVDHAYA